MPDFRATFTSGTSLVPWIDPPDSARSSRQNIIADHGHLRRLGTIGVEVVLTATVAGVAGPMDDTLDGRLFLCMFAEHPGAVPSIASPAGQSSVQRFTPASAGHYAIVFRRDAGGGAYLHLDVGEVD